MQRVIRWTGIRGLRTLRSSKRSPELLDVESQLASYPVETRKEILDQMRTETITESPAKIHKMKQRSAEEFQAGLVADALNTARSAEDLDENFWQTVRILSRSGIREQSSAHTDLFVRLFEAAKEIEDEQARIQLIYDIGRYIYSQKRVRFDPINEVEFLDSLVANGKPFDAIKLWQSRVGREDVNSLNWDELGILYHLDANLLHQADRLATTTKKNLTPRVASALINAWTLRARRGDREAGPRLTAWANALQQLPVNIEYYESSLDALIICRRWDLAEALLRVIPDQNLQSLERQAALTKAFVASANSRSTDEENDIMTFIQQFAEKIPDFPPSLLVSQLALSVAKRGDIDTAVELWHQAESVDKEFPAAIQRGIAKALLGHIQGEIWDLSVFLKYPFVFLEVLKSTKNRETAFEQVQNYINSGNSLVGPLALYILKRRLYANDAQVKQLIVNEACQRYAYYLCATGRVGFEPEIITKELRAPPSVQTLKYMCLAYINHYKDYTTGVEKLFLSLRNTPSPNHAEALYVMGWLMRLRSNPLSRILPPTVLRSPSKKPPRVGAEISWEVVANKVHMVLEGPAANGSGSLEPGETPLQK